MAYPRKRRPSRLDGFKSDLEAKVAGQLISSNVPVVYERDKLKYRRPATDHTYTPDFCLREGVYIEAKGYFEPGDRVKHLLVRDSNPEVEIRFLFSNAHKSIYKGSKTTYARWCDKNGFKWADKVIPISWIMETKNG